MINFLHTLLKTYEVSEDSFWHGGALTLWHFVYVFVIGGTIIGAAFLLKNKSEKTKKTVLNVLPIVVIGLYVADLFLRPISQLEIVDGTYFMQPIKSLLDKLPFHICTVMAPLCVFAQHSKRFAKIKEPLVILGIVGPLMYMTYPNTVFGDAFPFCYNTLQTMIYHGVLLAWGVLNLTTGQTKVSIKRGWYSFAACIGSVFLWALFGNIVFSDMSSVEAWVNSGYDWFFQKSGSFYIAQGELWYAIVAPIGVASAVYLVGMGVYGVYHLIKLIASPKKKNEEVKAEEKEYSSVS